MITRKLSVALTGFLGAIALYGATFTLQACGDAAVICPLDASPDDPICGSGGAGGQNVEPSIKPETCTGRCLPAGPSNFRVFPVLVWMGPDEEEPECPERAQGDYFDGYEGLTVDFPCQKCECEPAKCVMSAGLVTSSNDACQGGDVINFDAPTDWDGSCISPAQIPPGSFRSIELSPATVTSCKSIGNADPTKSPSFAPQTSSFAGGVYWNQRVKACQGFADGHCSTSDYKCIADIKPAPPEFRYCVEYSLPPDENDLPQCPGDYPDRFLFHRSVSGKPECTPCECGEPVGAQCTISLSAYQDAMCAGAPMPLFENVPAGNSNGTCIDFGGMQVSLESMSAQWIANEPGHCEPKGGELVNQVKPKEPHVFCCQPLEPSEKAPIE